MSAGKRPALARVLDEHREQYALGMDAMLRDAEDFLGQIRGTLARAVLDTTHNDNIVFVDSTIRAAKRALAHFETDWEIIKALYAIEREATCSTRKPSGSKRRSRS